MKRQALTPLDPQLAAIVAGLQARGAPPLFSGSPAQARRRMHDAAMAARAGLPMAEIAGCLDTVAPGEPGVPLRIYRPVSTASALPTVVFFHGGGFVLGSVALADDIARKLCRDLAAVVVSVEYRLAPEHPFPAAHDDALAALQWVQRQAAELGGDARRISVAGESAGANLAASTALRLRDLGTPVAAQLLVVPGVDMGRDLDRIAATGLDYPMLGVAELADIARLSIGATPELAHRMPASPLYAASLAGAPPAVIAVAGHDPLREEGLAYAERLRADGVPVQTLDFADMFHPFLGFVAKSDAARRASDLAFQAFAGLLGASDA